LGEITREDFFVKTILLSVAFAIGLLPGTSFAQSAAGGQNPGCFFADDFGNWKAPDDKTIYIRLHTHRMFRLDLAGHCPLLIWPSAVLVSKFSGSTAICHPIDWNLEVTNDPGRPPHACIVRAMTELSPEDAAALPKGSKP
jgi:hypothetical protein